MRTSFENAKNATIKLLEYCQEYDWTGYDPYDALNSKIFKGLSFLDFRLPRLVLTQMLKKSPVNLRLMLLIPKTQNPKAIALFLMAFLKLSRLGLLDRKGLVTMMVERLVAGRSPNTPYWCWGYSFPWQTRTHVVPRQAPNLVCTTFVANALLDAYDMNPEPRYLSMAASAAEYILHELYWTEDDFTAGFSYPFPLVHTRVHNANFLGAALFCRIYKHSGEKKFLEPALKVVRYSASKQHDDGSWDYGELSTQRWADNFHTGYNLGALRSIGHYAETLEFEPHIRRGFEFYRKSFFMGNGAPKYFYNRAYPIDIHCVAQSIITLLELSDLDEGNVDLAHSVFGWAMNQMWDERGYFYYQILPYYTNKISYMRWSQAWMLLALSTLLEDCNQSLTGTRCNTASALARS
ncbi:MAG TPA: hypothetical protein VJ044_15925 [Candidatus Hodarchaeales archaeon]|nr:hypothetical protein [Candidatus Hodarchaeales archaeon]